MKVLLFTAGGLAVLTAAVAQPSAGKPTALPVPAGAGAAAAASSSIRRIELPPESGTYRQGPGVELATAFCLNCHSTEYCESQPALPEKYWDGTVKKMKEKFGAPLPDEAMAPLVKYLTGAYGKPSP